MEIMDTWNDITPNQRIDIIKDLIEDTQGQGLNTKEAEGLLNLGRMQIEAEEADKGDQYLKQALFYLKRIREQNLDDPSMKALMVPPPPGEAKPVLKPSKGRCSQCKNDHLRFHDDGSGDCPDCGRKFTWDKNRARKPEQSKDGAPEPQMALPPPPKASVPCGPRGDMLDLPTDEELASLDFSGFDGPSPDPQETGPPEPIAPEPHPPEPLPPMPTPGPEDPESPEPPPQPDDDDDDGDDDDDFDASGAKRQIRTGPEPVPTPAETPRPVEMPVPMPTEAPRPVEMPEPMPTEAPRPVEMPEPMPIPAPAMEIKTPPPQGPRPATDIDVNSLFSDIMLEQKKECDVATAPPVSQPQPAAPASATPQEDPEKRILKMACEKAQVAYEKMEAKRKEGADVKFVDNLLGKSRAAMAQKDYVAALNMAGEALRVIDGIVVPSTLDLLEPTPVPAPEPQRAPPGEAARVQEVPVYHAPEAQRMPREAEGSHFAPKPSAQVDLGIVSEPIFQEDRHEKVFSLDPSDTFTSVYETPQQDRSVYDSRGHNDQHPGVYSEQANKELSPYGGFLGSTAYQGPVEAQPAYVQQPLLNALCYNCNGLIPIYSDQRPLVVSCPSCGVQVQLD